MSATNDLQRRALQLLSAFAAQFSCIKAVHLFGSVARGATDKANDVDLFFEYIDDMPRSTEQVAAFTDFQGKLEGWLVVATHTLGKPVKPCRPYYGERDEKIWQAIKATPPTASLGKAFIVPTPAVEKH
jgi:predicted nucleotidyltransferase